VKINALPSTLLCLLALASAASAQDPVFRGPEVHSGAWATSKKWSDPVAGPRDFSQGSYAYAYQSWAKERADKYVTDRTRLDCADLSIALLCEYAALNKLPVVWRAFYPPERRFVTVTNEDRQFDTPEAFRKWSQWFLGAMNLADNTDAITYDEWAGGDMLLMDWNQTDESPNFGDREVWHTYLIGEPDQVIYYGNISGGNALPVTRVTSGSRMDMVRNHPDRYGHSPRRYRLFRNAVVAPRAAPKQTATVIRASRLNLRTAPRVGSDTHLVDANGDRQRALRGEAFEVIGRDGRWVQVRLADGREAWAHSYYLRVEDVVEANTTGAIGALGALGN